MEFLRFIFSSFWVWMGFAVLVYMAGNGIVAIVKALRRDRSVYVDRVGERFAAKIEGASAEDARTAMLAAYFGGDEITVLENKRDEPIRPVREWGETNV